MDVKEVKQVKQETSYMDFCSENERELLTKHSIKKVKSETVTSSSDCDRDTTKEIQEEAVGSKFCSRNDAFSEHNLMRCSRTFKEGEIETKIDIKEEQLWLETNSSEALLIKDEIKDGADVDFYKPSLYKDGDSSYTSDLFSSEDLGNHINFNMNKNSAECESGIKPLKCHICNKGFTDLSSLKRHKLTHEGTRPHKCNICNKDFISLSKLKRHELIHDGIKPHKCNICNKAFTLLSNLKKHKLIHDGIKSHQCNICNRAFTLLPHLKRHKLIHEGIKPHKCDICNKAFARLSSLKRHKLIHEGIKPHNCNICNKAFTLSSHLKRHKLIHDGIKPHKCNVCNRAFTYSLTLKRHILTHRDKKPR